MSYFSTKSLAFVIEETPRPKNFLLDTFFPRIVKHQTEEVYFERAFSAPRMVSYIHPKHRASLTENSGYSAETVKPAYIKDKRAFDPENAVKKMVGEKIGGTKTIKDRILAQVARIEADQVRMLETRQEYMAAEALVDARSRIEGPGYSAPMVVNYRRSPLMEKAADWRDPKRDILQDLNQWLGLMRKVGKGRETHTIVSEDVATVMMANEHVKKHLDQRRGVDSDFGTSPVSGLPEDVEYLGKIGGVHVYTYFGEYQAADGTMRNFIPPGTLVMVSKERLYGVRHYGAIMHEGAMYKAHEYFAHSWVDPELGQRFMQLQAAPLIVPHRASSSLRARIQTGIPASFKSEFYGDNASKEELDADAAVVERLAKQEELEEEAVATPAKRGKQPTPKGPSK